MLLAEKIGKFNQQAEQHLEKQSLNPFSGRFSRSPSPRPRGADYGKPVAGSLTDIRGQKAKSHICKEILELCQCIHDVATYNREQRKKDPDYEPDPEVDDDPNLIVSFGELFQIYTKINDKVVGLLIAAKKRGFVYFEKEILFQRRDDDVLIALIKPISEIRNALRESLTPSPLPGANQGDSSPRQVSPAPETAKEKSPDSSTNTGNELSGARLAGIAENAAPQIPPEPVKSQVEVTVTAPAVQVGSKATQGEEPVQQGTEQLHDDNQQPKTDSAESLDAQANVELVKSDDQSPLAESDRVDKQAAQVNTETTQDEIKDTQQSSEATPDEIEGVQVSTETAPDEIKDTQQSSEAIPDEIKDAQVNTESISTDNQSPQESSETPIKAENNDSQVTTGASVEENKNSSDAPSEVPQGRQDETNPPSESITETELPQSVSSVISSTEEQSAGQPEHPAGDAPLTATPDEPYPTAVAPFNPADIPETATQGLVEENLSSEVVDKAEKPSETSQPTETQVTTNDPITNPQ